MFKTSSLCVTPDPVMCDLFVGHSLTDRLALYCREAFPEHKLIVIADETVLRIYGDWFEPLHPGGSTILPVPPGEQSKSRDRKAQLEDELLSLNCGRRTLVVAVGGGVVGDLAGYVAATYQRGIPIIQVPTTLLAMVDSAIGGKTGVNHPAGKNLLGAFWLPRAVFADLSFLSGLPDDDYSCGLAEAIKMAITMDQDLYDFIEKSVDPLIRRDVDSILEVVQRSIALKKTVVEKDLNERNLRQVLNFGHTIGHAIENALGYAFKHGYCVSIGMICEAILAHRAGYLDWETVERLALLLQRLRLPTRLPREFTDHLDRFWSSLAKDKKNKGTEARGIYLTGIGMIRTEEDAIVFPFSRDEITAVCRELLP